MSKSRICPNCRKETQFEYYWYPKSTCQMCHKNGTDCYGCKQCRKWCCNDCLNKAESQERIAREKRETEERKRLERQRLERERREREERQRLEREKKAAERARLQRQKMEKERKDRFLKSGEQRLSAVESEIKLKMATIESVQTQQSMINTQLNAFKTEIQRRLTLEHSRNEENFRLILNRLDAIESDSKQPQTEERKSADFTNKPLSYIVMHWFITEYCEMPYYVSNFESDGMNAMDSRILFHIGADELKRDFKIKQWHIQPILTAIDSLKADWTALQSFLLQCKAVDLSRYATVAQNKGLLGWDALAFVATDEQRLAQIFGVEMDCKPIHFLWNAIVPFKKSGQRPIVDNDNPIASVAASATEIEGNRTDTKSFHY